MQNRGTEMKIKIINPNTTIAMTKEVEEIAKNAQQQGLKYMQCSIDENSKSMRRRR